MILYLLSAGISAHTEIDGRTPMISAAMKGNLKIIQMLVAGGIDVNHKTSDGSLALSGAALNGHVECVELFIKVGANVNASNGSGESPLHFAAGNGHVHIVEMLIKAGADVNCSTNSYESPLRWAAKNGHVQIVDILIKAGADVAKTYTSSQWGLSFKYPADWETIFENDSSGTWSIPITVGGEMRAGQRPAFMVNARRDEMISPPHVTIEQLRVDGSFYTAPHSPSEYIERSKEDLPKFFDDVRFLTSDEIRLKGGIPAAREVYTYDSSGRSVTELSVTAFCRNITYQFICDMPSLEQERYMGIFDDILESIDIAYSPVDITWTAPADIRTYGDGGLKK